MSHLSRKITLLACMTLVAWGCDDGSDDGEGGSGGNGGQAGSGGAVGGNGGGLPGGSGGGVGGGLPGGSGGSPVGGSPVGGEPVGGEPVGGEPVGGGGPGNANCIEIFECVANCGEGDDACATACVEGGSAEGQQLYGQFLTCRQNSGCAGDDAECLTTSCGNEITACQGGGGGGEFDCETIPAGMNLGMSCESAEACGEGGDCLQAQGDEGPACYQRCIPGQCTDLCGEGEACAGIADENGNPQTLPDGTAIGACVALPEGDLPSYSVCGEDPDEACMAGAACLVFAQGEPGFCAPACDNQGEPCADGMGACVLGIQGSEDVYCGILCENIGSAEGCPDGLTCQDAGGGGLCLP